MPRVLVIDDSVSVRKVVERALAGREVEVVCAASGGEALDRLESDVPDMIVCDVVMPDRDGYEICDFVKNHPRLATTPVILMSGIVNDEVRQRAARARSEGVLSKPFAAEDLLRRLESILGPLGPKAPAPPDTPDAAPSVAASPVATPVIATPTLMPVSALTVEPMTTPTAPPAAMPEPERDERVMAGPDPGVVPALEPVRAHDGEPTIAAHLAALGALAAERRVEPEWVRAPTPPATAASPATAAPAPADAAGSFLAQFAAMDGVQWAVLADREGFVVEATTHAGVDADVAAALSACLAESSSGLGRELGRGALHGLILEYENGMVVVYGVGSAGLLAVGLGESAVLGKVRYVAKKTLPELARAF
jgi:CheY-like chemotaxis protein/predicted regulator of Ras-like GTPase activity (Roadblock/LC7/MglB family)